MKTSAIMIIGLIMVTGFHANSQDKRSSDPSYSAYNYKHPNKAAYARKHNLDKAPIVGEIQVTQNENYKHSNSLVTSKKLGAVSNDKNKLYANDKHPQVNIDSQDDGATQIAKKKRIKRDVSPSGDSQKGKN